MQRTIGFNTSMSMKSANRRPRYRRFSTTMTNGNLLRGAAGPRERQSKARRSTPIIGFFSPNGSVRPPVESPDCDLLLAGPLTNGAAAGARCRMRPGVLALSAARAGNQLDPERRPRRRTFSGFVPAIPAVGRLLLCFTHHYSPRSRSGRMRPISIELHYRPGAGMVSRRFGGVETTSGAGACGERPKVRRVMEYWPSEPSRET